MRRSAASDTTGNQTRNAPSTNPYELRQVRFELTQAQAIRTQNRVDYYNNLASSTEANNRQENTSTQTGPTDIESENPDFEQLEWISESASAHARPYATFPWCSYHKITWHLVTSDATGLIWTRTLLNGQQEWLTGSLLADGNWQFNQTREVSDIHPA